MAMDDMNGGGGNVATNRKNGGLGSLINYDDLPEAEVEVLPDNYDYGSDDGWFYQQPASDDDGWYYQESSSGSSSSSNNQQYEEPVYNYGEYLNNNNNYDYDSDYSYTSSPNNQVEQPIVENTQARVADIIEQEEQAVQQQTQQNVANAMLRQSAAEDLSKVNPATLPITGRNASDMEAFQNAVQATRDRLESSPTTAVSQRNPVEDQSILNWNWRNGYQNPLEALLNIGVTPAVAAYPYDANIVTTPVQTRAGNMVLPPNYQATDSNSGTSMLQNNVAPTSLQNVVAETPKYGDWRDNFQMNAPILSTPVEQAPAQTPQSTATIAPQQMAQVLNDPTARQFFEAAKRDGETDTNAAIFAMNQTNALNQRNANWSAENSVSQRERYRQVQAETAGQNSLYGNRLSQPENSIERFIDNGGLDKSAQIVSDFKNMRVQAENQKRITETARQLAKADGLDYNKLSYDQQAVYEDRAAGQTKLVNETTPEYQRQLIQNTIDTNNARTEQTQNDLNNLIGYSDNETGSQDLANRNYEPINNSVDKKRADANAISELTIHLANLGYAPDTASYVARYSIENGIDPDKVVKYLAAQQAGYTPYKLLNGQDYWIGIDSKDTSRTLTAEEEATAKEYANELIKNGYNETEANSLGRYAVTLGVSLADAEYLSQQQHTNGTTPSTVVTGGGKRTADLTEQDKQNMTTWSKQLQDEGYNKVDADSIADYAVRYGVSTEDAANMYKQGRLEGTIWSAPALDANGNPNETLQAILNGEFTIDLEAEGLEKGTDYYEVARQGNAERILHLFDSADGFTGLVIPKELEKFIASSYATAVGAGKVAVWGESGIEIGGNPSNVELVKATGEELSKAVDALIKANPQLEALIQKGLLTRDDIMNHFFKGITETKEEAYPKSYGGGGSRKSSSSGGRRGGGGGRGYSSGGGYSNPTVKEQKQARINNIMKNWTF